ncbi:MAG: hypothetical protein R3C68_16655 [Myxococcota bacterium]
MSEFLCPGSLRTHQSMTHLPAAVLAFPAFLTELVGSGIVLKMPHEPKAMAAQRISIHQVIEEKLAYIVFSQWSILRTRRTFAREALVRTRESRNLS